MKTEARKGLLEWDLVQADVNDRNYNLPSRKASPKTPVGFQIKHKQWIYVSSSAAGVQR